MDVFIPRDKAWYSQIAYLPWIQPDLPGMEQSPVLPAYPVFIDQMKNGMTGEEFFSAVAGTMAFLLGHEPAAGVNAKYCAWLRAYNTELAGQLFFEGTEMMTRYNLPQAIWMLQASVLLEPSTCESHYNLALAFNYLGTYLTKKGKLPEAGECYRQARQYFANANQLGRV